MQKYVSNVSISSENQPKNLIPTEFQRITRMNVWDQALIDKLASLVINHNAYIRNFRNIAKSLDASMKIYEIRVDSVYCDVRRMFMNFATNPGCISGSRRTSSRSESTNEMNHNIQNGSNQPKKKIRRSRSNIVTASTLNAPLNQIQLPDDLIAKLNIINDDTAASSRLFTTVLSTENSFLQLNNRRPYIERNDGEILNVSITYGG